MCCCSYGFVIWCFYVDCMLFCDDDDDDDNDDDDDHADSVVVSMMFICVYVVI